MHTKKTLVAWMMAGLVLAGCSGSDEAPPITEGDDGLTLTFETVEFEVPLGDSFECFYTDAITPSELSVWGATGKQHPGGHHILVYYTENPRPAEHHPCNENDRVSLHQVAGSAGQDDGGEVLGLKENLALKVPKGVQLVLEAHYINTTSAPYKAKDAVTLKLLDPANVRGYVNYFITFDEQFEVPPSTAYTSTTYCKAERDFDMVLSLPHMHEQGKRFTLDIVDDDDHVVKSLIDDEWEPAYTSHPPIDYFSIDDPLRIPAGTTFKQSCSWDNTTAAPLLFPREMCLTFFYYYPGEGDVICDAFPR